MNLKVERQVDTSTRLVLANGQSVLVQNGDVFLRGKNDDSVSCVSPTDSELREIGQVLSTWEAGK